MDVKVKDGKMTLVIDFNEKGVNSKSGKTNVHASTNGNIQTEVKVNGKNLVIGLNAYTHKEV